MPISPELIMGPILDAAYLVAAAVTAPKWSRKARGGWAERFGKGDSLPPPDPARPRLLIHAVSVGEVNAIRPLVETLRNSDRLLDLVVSATTDTGLARAHSIYDSTEVRVVRYPLDASFAVRRFLDRVCPDGVALAELELWPNFVRACRQQRIPIGIVNGRLSARSFKRYHAGKAFVGPLFRSALFAAVQDDQYAERFNAMGTQNVTVTGSLKWDAARVVPPSDQPSEQAREIARSLKIDLQKPLVVAGSTAPEEHALLHQAVPEGVQLLCAPRRPEWWDDAARDLGPNTVRRSAPSPGTAGSDRFLLDTIGELDAAYELATVVVIGRSFNDLHGSDPMQPASLAKPVLIGPAHGDFLDAVTKLDQAGGLDIVTQDTLSPRLAELLGDADECARMGDAAQQCVIDQRGASIRTAELLHTMLANRAGEQP